jgi:hypothetical protein
MLVAALCLILASSAVAAAETPPIPTLAAGVPEALEPPVLRDEEMARWRPSAEDPPELGAIKLRILKGENGAQFIKELQMLGHRYAKNPDIPYLLGQIYLGKLWVADGLKLLRRAIELDERLRGNPFLIRAALNGLGNDGEATRVRRFLVQDIGMPAAPYLEEVLYGEWRQQVKARASDTLREILAAPI